jgi:hypothetical protein
MASHVVRPHAEENAGAHTVLAQQFQQFGYAVTRSPEGVDINA